MNLKKIISDFRAGTPIIIFDDPKREGEADIVIHAKYCTPDKIRLLRKDAGGLICLATDEEIANVLGIELMAKRMADAGLPTYRKLAIKKTAYGDMPSFSIYINSRKVRTGITDNDRSKTIMEFEGILSLKKEKMQEGFVLSFCSPGHVPLLISQGLEKRKGHTEYSTTLAQKAGMSSAVVVCEMLSDDGKALSFEDAKKYAKKNKFNMIEGKELAKMLND
ncbi:MAG: 3,4-dihydroxy-2-butanone-4-phosphate synthase [Candidatus Micrarchaeia archaeon]